MQRKELEEYLNAFLDIDQISDYCPNGVQIEGREKISKIATAVSANLETIEKAVSEEVDALIVHHGLFWNQDPYPIVGTKRKKLQLLLKHELSLFAYHLPLDAHREVGNNWKAALDLKWNTLEPFGEFKGTFIGVKGTFESILIDSFISKLEAYYQHKATKALGGKKMIQSAALISGGAYRKLPQAAKEDVDCFITGNFDEPAWNTALEEAIHFLALGHTSTEQIGPKALSKHIDKHLGISSQFIEVMNPF